MRFLERGDYLFGGTALIVILPPAKLDFTWCNPNLFAKQVGELFFPCIAGHNLNLRKEVRKLTPMN
jgi:hypothetical protein